MGFHILSYSFFFLFSLKMVFFGFKLKQKEIEFGLTWKEVEKREKEHGRCARKTEETKTRNCPKGTINTDMAQGSDWTLFFGNSMVSDLFDYETSMKQLYQHMKKISKENSLSGWHFAWERISDSWWRYKKNKADVTLFLEQKRKTSNEFEEVWFGSEIHTKLVALSWCSEWRDGLCGWTLSPGASSILFHTRPIGELAVCEKTKKPLQFDKHWVQQFIRSLTVFFSKILSGTFFCGRMAYTFWIGIQTDFMQNDIQKKLFIKKIALLFPWITLERL